MSDLISDNQKRVWFVGDFGIGKTTLLQTIDCGRFLDYIVHEQFLEPRVTVQVIIPPDPNDTTQVELHLIDNNTCDPRFLSNEYRICSCLVLCYTVDSTSSFTNLRAKWLPMLRNEIQGNKLPPPFLVLGMRCDLPRTVPIEDASSLAQELATETNMTVPHLECSSLASIGLEEMTNVAAALVVADMRRRVKSERRCIVL